MIKQISPLSRVSPGKRAKFSYPSCGAGSSMHAFINFPQFLLMCLSIHGIFPVLLGKITGTTQKQDLTWALTWL